MRQFCSKNGDFVTTHNLICKMVRKFIELFQSTFKR